jgi:hypothetical protein
MRRILTAREQLDLLAPWLTAGRESDLMDYRTERHRQEVELEGLTGGHPTDIEDHFARGGKPLINYKDWLKGRSTGPGEQAAASAGVDPNFTYTPPPGSDQRPSW